MYVYIYVCVYTYRHTSNNVVMMGCVGVDVDVKGVERER